MFAPKRGEEIMRLLKSILAVLAVIAAVPAMAIVHVRPDANARLRRCAGTGGHRPSKVKPHRCWPRLRPSPTSRWRPCLLGCWRRAACLLAARMRQLPQKLRLCVNL